MIENETKIPQNVDAEERILACCLEGDRSDFFDSISHRIQPEDFYLYKHNLTFKCISSIAQRGQPLSEISLVEELKSSSAFDEVGGMEMVMTLMDKVTSSVEAVHLVNLVKDKSSLRNMIRAFKVGIEQAEDESESVDSIRGSIEKKLLDLDAGGKTDMSLSGSVEELLSEFEDQMNGEYKEDVVKTFIPHLDEKLGNGGIGAGEVVVISAPTSCGKSQLALNIATRASVLGGVGCGIFSLEMPQKQVAKRIITLKSGINLKRIKDRVAKESDMESVRKGCEAIKDMPMYSIHSIKNIGELCSHARTMVRRHKVKLLVIDYLHLIPFANKTMSKNDAVADISHTIKQLARELNVGVLLLSQVNREGARREGGLAIYDLKDSGDIENDADVIILMWPEESDMEYSKAVDGQGSYIRLKYNIAKNREGERDVKGKFKFYNHKGLFV